MSQAAFILILSMAILAGIFWVMEAKEIGRNMSHLPPAPHSRNPITIFCYCLQFIGAFITALVLSWKLPLDLICTILLAKSFSLGGVYGTAVGLTISNVISTYILRRNIITAFPFLGWLPWVKGAKNEQT